LAALSVRLLVVRTSLRLSLAALGTAALSIASLPSVAEPAKVAQGKAMDLGVMSVSLKDAVKLNYGTARSAPRRWYAQRSGYRWVHPTAGRHPVRHLPGRAGERQLRRLSRLQLNHQYKRRWWHHLHLIPTGLSLA